MITKIDEDKESPPNYIELNFETCDKIEKVVDRKDPDDKMVMTPPRLHHQQQQKLTKSTVNHHFHKHHQPPLPKINYQSNNYSSATNPNPRQESLPHEDPRDFATFLCIFASVMTTVLVLMFYMVGEAAFRLILLVISFVSILTLCLACFLRRPTLVILGQTVGSTNRFNSAFDNNNSRIMAQTPQPYLLIFPTLFGQDTHPTTTVQHLTTH